MAACAAWRLVETGSFSTQLAVAFLADSQCDDEPPLAIDGARVRERNGILIVPYDSVQYLALRDARQMPLGCRPILVDLERGDVRFGTLDERRPWRNPRARRGWRRPQR